MSVPILNKYGQAMSSEYVLVFFIAVGMITAMGVYFRRAIQARVFDADKHMIAEIKRQTHEDFEGELLPEYEPYYTVSDARITRDSTVNRELLPGGTSGVFKKSSDEITRVESSVDILPPKDDD